MWLHRSFDVDNETRRTSLFVCCFGRQKVAIANSSEGNMELDTYSLAKKDKDSSVFVRTTYVPRLIRF